MLLIFGVNMCILVKLLIIKLGSSAKYKNPSYISMIWMWKYNIWRHLGKSRHIGEQTMISQTSLFPYICLYWIIILSEMLIIMWQKSRLWSDAVQNARRLIRVWYFRPSTSLVFPNDVICIDLYVYNYAFCWYPTQEDWHRILYQQSTLYHINYEDKSTQFACTCI